MRTTRYVIVRQLLPLSLAIMASTSAMADTLTRMDAEIAVNAAAPDWIIDAANNHLTVERLQLPRRGGDIGFVCGAIVPIGSPRFETHQNSYHTGLLLNGDQLFVAGITALYEPVEELLRDPLCR